MESHAEIKLSIVAVRDDNSKSTIDYDFIKKVEKFFMNYDRNSQKDKYENEEVKEDFACKKITSPFDSLEP